MNRHERELLGPARVKAVSTLPPAWRSKVEANVGQALARLGYVFYFVAHPSRDPHFLDAIYNAVQAEHYANHAIAYLPAQLRRRLGL